MDAEQQIHDQQASRKLHQTEDQEGDHLTQQELPFLNGRDIHLLDSS